MASARFEGLNGGMETASLNANPANAGAPQSALPEVRLLPKLLATACLGYLYIAPEAALIRAPTQATMTNS